MTGASWYVLNTAGNALPDANNRWLIAQITTTGSISGQINYQVFPLGVGDDQIQTSMAFDGAGTFGGDGGSDVVCGCTEETACNYNADATNDDGSCTYAAANFDCDGNCLVATDCAGECGGLLTNVAFVAVVLTQMPTAFATTLTIVSVTSMNVVFATATASLKALVTVMEMSLTLAAFVAAAASLTVLVTATETS